MWSYLVDRASSEHLSHFEGLVSKTVEGLAPSHQYFLFKIS